MQTATRRICGNLPQSFKIGRGIHSCINVPNRAMLSSLYLLPCWQIYLKCIYYSRVSSNCKYQNMSSMLWLKWMTYFHGDSRKLTHNIHRSMNPPFHKAHTWPSHRGHLTVEFRRIVEGYETMSTARWLGLVNDLSTCLHFHWTKTTSLSATVELIHGGMI